MIRWLIAFPMVAGAWLWLMGRRNASLRRPPVLDDLGMPLPASRFTYSDGASVGLIDAGEGPVILLIPGADGMKETFRYQLPLLSQFYRVLCADLRDEITSEMRFDRLVTDVDELMAAHAVSRAVVVGQSLGGSIAMRFAVQHPEKVAALVVVNSLARVSYGHLGLNAALLAPVAMATIRYFPTALGRLMAQLWSRLNVWVFDSSPGSERVIDYVLWSGPRTVHPRVSGARVDLLKKEDLRPELGAIRVPTLVLKGPLDRYTPVAWSKEIAELIPGARYVEIADSGHCSHISMPEAFNRSLLGWLSEVDRQPGSGEDKA
ncbi:MAG: alpha/beta hydrolase [Gemmatimonadales bacterium]|nr:MAG: alpha/beta hydrolase [Gemmatimonadales bacterium]